jgi:hypothetical protein
VFNLLRKQEVFRSVRLHLQNSSSSHLNSLNNVSILDLQDAIRLKQTGKDIPSNHASKPVLDAVRIIGAKTLYSNHFKSVSRSEIRSCIIHHGSPALYITISPMDAKHILAYQICNRTKHLDLNNLPTELLDEEFRLKQASEDPVSLAQFFNVIVTNILSCLFSGGSNPKGGIFGPVKSYYGMVEAQNRGTLHIHLLLWIKGTPHPDTLYNNLTSNHTFKDSLFSYLNKIIKTDLNDYQAPKNTEYAETSQQSKVPYEPLLSPEQIQSSEQLSKFLRRAIAEYQTHKHVASCFKNPKTKGKCRYRKPNKLYDKTTFDAESGEINLKRNHPMINSFNPYLTSIANANTDISFLFRCKSAMAIIHYITIYITKNDDMVDNYYALMAAAKKSLTDYPMQSQISGLSEDQMAARALLLRIYHKINSCTQIPSNIVSTLLLNLPMSYKADEYKSFL